MKAGSSYNTVFTLCGCRRLVCRSDSREADSAYNPSGVRECKNVIRIIPKVNKNIKRLFKGRINIKMIIVISGNSQMGKTLMAQKLLEKYKIPYFSIDHLKMGIYRGFKNCGFTPTDSTEVIGDKLWPIIKGIIMTNIENNQSLIIEGCYILPHYLNEFENFYADRIISVFLGFSTAYIQGNYDSKILKYRSVIEDRGELKEEDSSEYTISEYIRENDEFRRKCLEVGETFFEITSNYKEEILKVFDYIDIQKRKIES